MHFVGEKKIQAPVVQTSDSAIHRINLYPVDSAMVSILLIRWIVIYPVDSAIQRLNNRGQVNKFFNLSRFISFVS